LIKSPECGAPERICDKNFKDKTKIGERKL